MTIVLLLFGALFRGSPLQARRTRADVATFLLGIHVSSIIFWPLFLTVEQSNVPLLCNLAVMLLSLSSHLQTTGVPITQKMAAANLHDDSTVKQKPWIKALKEKVLQT